jgi:hypothetical protein
MQINLMHYPHERQRVLVLIAGNCTTHKGIELTEVINMPLRTITMPDGTTRTRMITNRHPDGTEFLPEEFEITGKNEAELRIIDAMITVCRVANEKMAKEEARARKDNPEEK